MNVPSLVKQKPELFDGYDGRELTPEKQKSEAEYMESLAASAPDHIKQAIAEQLKQSQ